MSTTQSSYVLDSGWHAEKQRLDRQAALFEDHTRACLDGLGVSPGAACAEVGAGTGTVASWLCDRVGPEGRVVATDLDTRFVEALDHPALEVRTADITRDPLGDHEFDLVHERWVLMHLAERQQALAHMVEATRPGGWVVLEDYDIVLSGGATVGEPTPVRRIAEAMAELITFAGGDPRFGSAAAPTLAAAGLEDVRTSTCLHQVRCGSREAIDSFTLTLEQLTEPLVATGLSDQATIDAAGEQMETASGDWVFIPTLVTAMGRRPDRR